MSAKWLLCALLATSMAASCWAAAAADPAIHSKPSKINSAEPAEVKEGKRESHALRSDASYLDYVRPPKALPKEATVALPPIPLAPLPPANLHHQRPIPTPIHSNPNETTMGFVYYYLPQTDKYQKLKDLWPYFRSFERMAARAWPSVRKAADRTFDIGSALSLVVLAPVLLVSSVLFLVFMVVLFFFPAVSAFGKRRMGRDLSGLDDPDKAFDFDQFLPAEQSRTFATLAARVDNMLESYRQALGSDTCMERLSCEAGQITSRFGKMTQPIIK